MGDRAGALGLRIGIAVVTGRSMLPTLCEGDRLLVLYGKRPRIGALVVVRLPGRVERPLAVKRITRREGSGWWVERDNPSEGVDSWTVGVVPDDNVIGVVVGRIWPLISGPRRDARSVRRQIGPPKGRAG
jgi:nickel-type superoxide dismutase maturation protease